MKRWSMIVVACSALLALGVGCGSGGGGDAGNDPGLQDLADVPPVDVPDVVADVPGDRPGDEGADVPDVAEDVPADLPPADVPADVPMVTRHFTFRAIGGVSMGAAAMTVAAHHPDRFDAAGALGGYVDFRYVGHLMKDMMGGGFCPMEQLLEPDVLADINNPLNPKVFCGNPIKRQPHEYYWDFNHFHYDDDGGTWDRDFYFDVLESLVFANGNFMFYNPDNPLLPPGVDIAWIAEPDKCANPARVTYPNNINAEFNPKGEYDLITFCDGETPVGCKDGDPTKCGEANPDYRDLRGNYDPSHTYDRPVFVFLAVDYNGNGKRDYGEPIAFNIGERYRDVGKDGCANEFEDGKGGCLQASNGHPETDANGDDFDLLANPTGTEGNFEFEPGEPYDDYGIDGVPESVSGFEDLGEGDGQYTYNPRYEAMILQDARTFFNTAEKAELEKHTWYFEGGVRDALGALTVSLHLANALAARGEEVRRYDDFGGQPTSILPAFQCDDVVPNLYTVDFSKAAFGDNIVMAYGDPNSTEADAVNTRTGKHVGSGCEILLRPTIFYTTALARMPGALYNDDQDFENRIEYSSYYSEVLQSRRWFAVNLPPGYDRPENEAVKYPMGIMLPGVGMPLMETVEATRLLGLTQGMGVTPRFVLLAPDGQCCYRNTVTQERLCNCYRVPGALRCVDKACKGPHSECAVTDIPRDNLQQECNSGHFFFNQKTNRWGETDMAEARFEDSLLEVIDVAAAGYRVKEGADVSVPVGF